MKKAIQFGAGNIGRGFIGAVLEQAGYHVVFADVNEQVVARINSDRAYTVQIMDTVCEQMRITDNSYMNLDTLCTDYFPTSLTLRFPGQTYIAISWNFLHNSMRTIFPKKNFSTALQSTTKPVKKFRSNWWKKLKNPVNTLLPILAYAN